ncbi:MAG: PD-(D/E)XK nuclease family protein, partial [Clostridia bacterium]|nr:PD-(D/E)XK nuclease family protein [Clostridia bacterium]
DSIKRRIELMRSQSVSFDSILELNKKTTATEKGTATHLFLQFCDYYNVDKNGLENEIARLINKRFISERTAKIIDRDQLRDFFASKLYALIRCAKSVRREFRFGMHRPASDFTQNDKIKSFVSDKKIFVQGSIDLIIEDAHGELILCDYKTDKVTENERNDRALLISTMREKHGHQLKQYEYAIEQIFGRKPKKIFVYLTAIGEAIEL